MRIKTLSPFMQEGVQAVKADLEATLGTAIHPEDMEYLPDTRSIRFRFDYRGRFCTLHVTRQFTDHYAEFQHHIQDLPRALELSRTGHLVLLRRGFQENPRVLA